jgi:hypothetical protein
VTFSVTFSAGYAGAKSVFVYADDVGGNNTGYVPMGTFAAGSGTPGLVSLSPTSGSGLTQIFTAVYSDTAGAGTLNRRALVISSPLNSVGSCLITYQAAGFLLVNDAGNNQIGPLAPGGSISNSQCTLNSTGTAVTNSGNNSTVTFSVTFNSAYSGAKSLFLYADDAYGNNTGYIMKGSFVP